MNSGLLPSGNLDSSHCLRYMSSSDCKTSSASADGPLASTLFFPSPEGALGLDLGRLVDVFDVVGSLAPGLEFASDDFGLTDFFILI